MLVSIYIVREREERGKWRLRKAKDGQQQQNGPRLYLIKRWRIKNWQPRCSLRRQLGKQLVASPILWWPPVDYAQQSRKMRRPVKKSIRNQFRHMPTMKSPSQTNTTSYRALTYRNDVFFPPNWNDWILRGIRDICTRFSNEIPTCVGRKSKIRRKETTRKSAENVW